MLTVEQRREVIASWLAERWGYKTVPEACWKDADELATRLEVCGEGRKGAES